MDIPVYEAAPLKMDQLMDAIGRLVLALDHDRVTSFDGRSDHINAENWLNDMEELLTTTGCTNEQKVAYTTYKLTGEAKLWWQVVQEAKALEFLDLAQGSMQVIEYATKFLQLSRFGMYLISNEEKKEKKFEWGLNTRIRTMLTCFDICDFPQLVDQALIYEESLKENALEYVDQKRRAQGPGTLVGGVGPAKRMEVES
ncbi:uncharacterized protein LOC132190835 [Corylus avellana]|uniref:uncharacterized protein LOC132190835 n=1 Tax=Corylus avellana TaxID=13451 RepID=UPI00286B610F|nr:uncharacterized protein LOC132190835 [Corylus avellana]